jgi:putative transposase
LADLERQIDAFVAHYNHVRYHESLDNLTPANLYFGRAETILAERLRIKRVTIDAAALSLLAPLRHARLF